MGKIPTINLFDVGNLPGKRGRKGTSQPTPTLGGGGSQMFAAGEGKQAREGGSKGGEKLKNARCHSHLNPLCVKKKPKGRGAPPNAGGGRLGRTGGVADPEACHNLQETKRKARRIAVWLGGGGDCVGRRLFLKPNIQPETRTKTAEPGKMAKPPPKRSRRSTNREREGAKPKFSLGGCPTAQDGNEHARPMKSGRRPSPHLAN